MKKSCTTQKINLSKYISGPVSLDDFPALSSGLQAEEGESQPGLREGKVFPPFLSSTVAHKAALPACVACQRPVDWERWVASLGVLPLGRGKFYGRCCECEEKDASFKDGGPS